MVADRTLPLIVSQVSKTQYDRVWSYIEAGKKEGAKVLTGGTKRSTPGFYVDPTSRFIASSDA